MYFRRYKHNRNRAEMKLTNMQVKIQCVFVTGSRSPAGQIAEKFKSWKTERHSGAMVNLNRQREQFLCRQWVFLTKNQPNKLENWENPKHED